MSVGSGGGLRLFLGVALPAEVVSALAGVRDALARQSESGRFASDDQFHITLCFLGDVAPARLPEVREAMARGVSAYCAKERGAFELTLSRLGHFGDRKRGCVCFAGVGGQVDLLRALQQSQEAEMARIGFPGEARGYHPITLGRSVVADPARLPEVPQLAFPAASVTLFESRARRGGRVYVPLERVKCDACSDNTV